jgi:hypothetical protein
VQHVFYHTSFILAILRITEVSNNYKLYFITAGAKFQALDSRIPKVAVYSLSRSLLEVDLKYLFCTYIYCEPRSRRTDA